jgi:hypothetical protein
MENKTDGKQQLLFFLLQTENETANFRLFSANGK